MRDFLDGALAPGTTRLVEVVILGAAVALCGIAGIVKFIVDTPDQRRATLARLGRVPSRAHSDTDISWPTGLAIIGAVVAFFLYLGFRVHTQ